MVRNGTAQISPLQIKPQHVLQGDDLMSQPNYPWHHCDVALPLKGRCTNPAWRTPFPYLKGWQLGELNGAINDLVACNRWLHGKSCSRKRLAVKRARRFRRALFCHSYRLV
jgi:hypothetical protein|tara:strand:- start:128 stop:460 length:333 start_codon:yes stop_codon:yes gene_type:complete